MNQKPPTVMDVALAAGVSKTTAVAILNNRGAVRTGEDTRKRVIDAAERLGYRPNALASALSRGRTGAIALVVPDYAGSDIYAQRGAYLQDLVMEVATAITGAGLSMSLVPASPELLANPRILMNGFYDGAIFATVEGNSLTTDLTELGFPCVRIGPGPDQNKVYQDNFQGIALAFRHLLNLGHRQIAYFGSGIAADCNLERETAFKRLCQLEPFVEPSVFSSPGAVFAEIIGLKPPTGIICFNDNHAIQVLRFCHQSHISVPEELSIIGFDDGLLALAAIPALTTVRNRLDLQAIQAVQLLQNLLAGRSPEAMSPIPVDLTIRETTGPRPRRS